MVYEQKKPCLHCGGDAKYLMTFQDYDVRQKVTVSTRIYWCEACRKESAYPDGGAPQPRPDGERTLG